MGVILQLEPARNGKFNRSFSCKNGQCNPAQEKSSEVARKSNKNIRQLHKI